MAEGILLFAVNTVINTIISNTDISLNNRVHAYKSNEEHLKAIAEDLKTITSVCQDAEARQYTSKSIKIWLSDLRSVVYDIEDVLDDVATHEKHKIVYGARFVRKLAHKAAPKRAHLYFEVRSKIKQLHEKLQRVVAKRVDFGLSEHPIEAPSVERDVFDACGYLNNVDIVGRYEAKNDIIKRVLGLHDQYSVSVVPILGMGGIGKTALAKLVYRDIDQFDIKLWVCVSHKFDFEKVLQDILTGATGENTSTYSFDQLTEKVQCLLRGKKFFLVLDDLWEDVISSWNGLKGIFNVGGRGSVILITSRLEWVASCDGMVEPYYLKKLSDSNCCRIFKRLAFAEGEEKMHQKLSNIGMSIVEKCRGIPLAVQCLGSSLRSKRNEREWSQINSLDNLYELEGEYEMVKKTIKLSYDKLPSDLKPCFAHLSLFARNSVYVPYYYFYCCSALGLLPPHDGTYFHNTLFNDLSSRSMLQDIERDYSNTIVKFKLHDVFHSVARDELGEDLSVVSNEKSSVPESSRFISWESADEEVQEPVKAKNARLFIFRFPMIGVSKSYLKGVISYMPYLRILCLGGSHFEEMPSSIDDLKHLRFLDLSNNGDLRSLSNNICKLVNLECLLLDRCKRLELPSGMNNLISLRFLSLTTCQNTLAYTKLNYSSSLRHLWLVSCTELVSLWDSGDDGCPSSLCSLQISDSPKLASLPNSMNFLNKLEELLIHDCQNLDLDRGEGLNGLTSLQTLVIERVPRLSRLPQGMISAARSLKSFWIRDCPNLAGLPDWLGSFTCLEKLGIVRCYNLQSLPLSISNLNSLQHLEIRGCEHIARLFETGENPTLPQHVHEVVIDDARVPVSSV